MPRITKKELAKQQRYYDTMNHNAELFSDRMIQRLGLIPFINDNLLCSEESLENNELLYFTYDGNKYIDYGMYNRLKEQAVIATGDPEAVPELPLGIKLFDPYNDIKLCINCVCWFLEVNLKKDTDRILFLNVTNAKMNDLGHATIKFDNMYELSGNEYHRDCIKYLDLIYKIDDANVFEYRDLAKLDIGTYEEFEQPENPDGLITVFRKI